MSYTIPPVAEIETFKRNNIALIPFLFSFVNLIFIWATSPFYRHDANINTVQFYVCLAIMSMIHFIYTVILLLAPRFLYRGKVWLKAIPWIISSTGLFTVFLMDQPTTFKYIYCILGFLFQLFQFIICVSSEETQISFIFKPFKRLMVPNLLAKIDLTDPNARLETVYGPPLSIPSTISGQKPAVVRYGSQAVKIQQHSQPIVINHQQPSTSYQEQTAPYYQPSVTPASVPSDLPPAYAPPVYQQTSLNSEKDDKSDKNSYNDSKSQYDVKQ